MMTGSAVVLYMMVEVITFPTGQVGVSKIVNFTPCEITEGYAFVPPSVPVLLTVNLIS